jgi:hypothetical protein
MLPISMNMNYYRKKVIFVTLLLISIHLGAQTHFKPSLIVLYPAEAVVTGDVGEKLKMHETEMEISEALRKDFIKDDLPLNWKLTREKELEFIQKQDYFVLLTLAISREITYKEIEYHHNSLIYPLKETIIEPAKHETVPYKKMAEAHQVTWIVNIKKAVVSREDGNMTLTVHYKLYNIKTNRFMRDNTVAFQAPENDVACSEDWTCLIDGIKDKMTEDLVHYIERNRHHH